MTYIINIHPWQFVYQNEEFYNNKEYCIAQKAIELFIKEEAKQAGVNTLEENSLVALSDHLYTILQLRLNTENDYKFRLELNSLNSQDTICSLVERIFPSQLSTQYQYGTYEYFMNLPPDIHNITESFLTTYDHFNSKACNYQDSSYSQAPYKIHINFPLETQLEDSYLAAVEIKEILLNAVNDKILNSLKSFNGLLDGKLELPVNSLGARFYNYAQVTLYLPLDPDFTKVITLIESINAIMNKYGINSKGAGPGDNLLAGGISMRQDYNEDGVYKSAVDADASDIKRNKKTPLYKVFKEHRSINTANYLSQKNSFFPSEQIVADESNKEVCVSNL